MKAAAGWLRWGWRQLTSMRTALLLLLCLAVATVPGSLVSQRSADPNGVAKFIRENPPELVGVYEFFSLFDVYSSPWFSAIYLLLFVSLVGCLVPRLKQHLLALFRPPPKVPRRLERLPGYRVFTVPAASGSLPKATRLLRRSGYRVRGDGGSVSAERGYLRETGNIVFHLGLLVVLVGVVVGGAWGYTGQRLLVEGESFANTEGDYDSFTPGRLFDAAHMMPYRIQLESFTATYEETGSALNYGLPLDYDARVKVFQPGHDAEAHRIRVNEPLRLGSQSLYLIGNGYAPIIRVTNSRGKVVFDAPVPFLPQDALLASRGVIKVPDGLLPAAADQQRPQLGIIAGFYPTLQSSSPPYGSQFPGLGDPLMTLQFYEGDLGLSRPQSAYSLDTSSMRPLAVGGGELKLRPGQRAELPEGLGSVEFVDGRTSVTNPHDYTGSVPRFISLDVHQDPAKATVLGAAVLVMVGLLLGLFVPRRRLWLRQLPADRFPAGPPAFEVAGLSRGDDPRLEDAVRSFAEKLQGELQTRILEAGVAVQPGEENVDDAEVENNRSEAHQG